MLTLEKEYESQDIVLLKDLNYISLSLFTPIEGVFKDEVFLVLGENIEETDGQDRCLCICIDKNGRNIKQRFKLSEKVRVLKGKLVIEE